MSKFFKSRSKPKAEAAPVPRAMAEIQAEYSKLLARAGEIQYRNTVGEADLAQVNQQLLNVNREAAARQQLDREAAPTPEAKNE